MSNTTHPASPSLVPFHLTYTLYKSNDFISYISALLALIPLCINVSYLTLIYFRREIELLLIFIGQELCRLLNLALKHLIQQPRPNPIFSGYGMPSNHAQFVSFFSGYFIIWSFYRARNLLCIPRTRNVIILSLLVVSVSLSRVYLQYHTFLQIVVGFFVGIVFSIVWFFFISLLRHLGFISWILHSKLNNYLRFKDTMNHEHFLIKKEWLAWKESQTAEKK